MFQFPGFASTHLWIQCEMTPKSRVSPFGNPWIKACLSAPQGLSQTTTSFIAFYRLGIHRMHLFTWPYNLKHTPTRSFNLLLRCFSSLSQSCVVHTLLPSLLKRLVLSQNLFAGSKYIDHSLNKFSKVSSSMSNWLKLLIETAVVFLLSKQRWDYMTWSNDILLRKTTVVPT